MLVKDVMTTDLNTLFVENTVKDAAHLMINNNVSIVPVVDREGRLLGVVTQSDYVGKKVEIPHAVQGLKQIFGENFHSKDISEIFAAVRDKKLGDVMTKDARTVTADDTINHVLNMILNHELKRIPVVDGDKLIGIITRRDIMKAFTKIS